MTEPASVVAARQPAGEARARWAGAECATRAVTSARKPLSSRTRGTGAALLAVVAAVTAGCDGPATACPAIGYASALVVELAPDWPAGVDRAVELDCDPACSPPILVVEDASPVPLPGMPGTPAAPVPTPTAEPTPVADPVVAVDARGRATVQLYDGRPGEVTVRVLADGAVVAELTVQPEFERIDGTEECGGSTEARIVVPAP